MRKPSDVVLIRQSLAGNQEAFVELVRRHEEPLAALIRYQVSGLHHAEDVFQETLLSAWVSLPRLRDRTKVRAWLLQVARNRCREFHKSHQRHAKTVDQPQLIAYVNRYGRTVRNADAIATEAVEALENVPPAARKAARLFYLRGLTIAEIAKRTRRPPGTVKRLLFHARAHMRRTLGITPSKKEKQDE